MKNYVVGFIAIMSVGFTFALVGGNSASNMLATLFTSGALLTTDSGVGTTTTTAITTATTTEPITLAEVPRTPAPEQQNIRVATLNGLVDNQVLSGVYLLSVSTSDTSLSAEFIISPIPGSSNSLVVRSITNCISSGVSGSVCAKEINTQSGALPNGGYKIAALVSYADGTFVKSNQVSVYVSNGENPKFIFASLPNPLVGKAIIRGQISEAETVEFLIGRANESQVTHIGNGSLVGDGVERNWIYEWNTMLVPNGTYTIIAKVKNTFNNGVVYEAGKTTITIVNKEEAVSPEATTTIIVSMPTIATTTTAIDRTEETSSATTTVPVVTQETEQVEQPKTVAEKFLEQVRVVEKREEPVVVQQAPAPVLSIAQRIQDVAVELQEGNSVAVTRELDALKEELWKGVNPTNNVIQENVQNQSAKTFGTTVAPIVMQVTNVTLSTTTVNVIVPVATTTATGEKITVKEKRAVVKEKLKLTGKALPNMYVTIYIYSEVPTIAVVKTDRNGNWVYELDNKLADGNHEAYVTINDRTGKVVAKSAPFGFVKTAEAVTIEQLGALGTVAAASEEPIKPVQRAKEQYGMAVFLLIIAGLLTGVFLMLRAPKREKQTIV